MIRSATGYQLERAELLAYGSDGRPHPRRPRARYEIPVKETRPTPNSTHGLEDRQGISRALSSLTDEEREILRLQSVPVRFAPITRHILAGDLPRAFANGYQFVRSLPEEKRADGTPVNYAEIVGLEPVNLTYEQIAERLGLTARQVHRRVSSAHRKLRAAR
jgi:RNA polymerase sigma factor (sigma-70 family)